MKRWLQFRLKSLLCACAVVSLLCGWIGNVVYQFRFEQAAVEKMLATSDYSGSTIRVRLTDRNLDPTNFM